MHASDTASKDTVSTKTSASAISQPLAQKAHSSGGVLVLQWLTYAFWFWFGVSTSWLAGVVINFFISSNVDSSDWGETLAYPLASVIIMMIIALVTDMLYAKHEPAKKIGGANVIMLLHVVPFVLMAIGALVTVVFALINMLISNDLVSAEDGPLQIMLVAIVALVLLGLAAARVFFGDKPRLRLIVRLAFIVVALGFIIAGIFGPALQAIRTKDDRLVERALPSLASDIRDYTRKNDKLPDSLSSVSYGGYNDTAKQVQLAIDKRLIRYKPNTQPAGEGSTYNPGEEIFNESMGKSSGISYYPSEPYPNSKRFYYQLCATYKYEKKSRYSYSEGLNYAQDNSASMASDYISSYVTISSHPAGEVCYNLYADGSYGDAVPLDATE